MTASATICKTCMIIELREYTIRGFTNEADAFLADPETFCHVNGHAIGQRVAKLRSLEVTVLDSAEKRLYSEAAAQRIRPVPMVHAIKLLKYPPQLNERDISLRSR